MLHTVQRMNSWIYLLFSFFVLFNLLDLSSTIVALKLGLSEANSFLLLFSSLMGIGITPSLIILKVIFIAGMGSLVLIAIRSNNSRTSRMIFFAEIVLTLVFFVVAFNNFLVISSV